MTPTQRIEIRNFGPIKEVDLPIADYTLFIGPNASGKSTIAKLVYFFQTPIISIDLDQIQNSVKPVTSDKKNIRLHLKEKEKAYKEAVDLHIQSQPGLKKSWEDAVRSHFQELWDIQALQEDFQVSYYFKLRGEDNWRDGISIKKINDKPNVTFTDDYVQWICTSLTRAINPLFVGGGWALRFLEEELPLFSIFSARESRSKHTQFIPAGRQFLSFPTDSFPLFSEGRIEPLVEEFMRLVKRKKSSFHKFIQDEINEIEQSELKRLEQGGEPENVNWGFLETMKLVLDLSAKILKGKYINPREGERIYFNEKQFVKLFEASSGQQESLWIINLIYLVLADYTWSYSSSNFTIIEEPEAHLYPETQKAVTELISLLANQSGNQVMLTTHSPYILSALNNLLYAHKVAHANEKAKWKEVSEVIPEPLWDNLNINRVAAYVVENGTIRSIIDRDLGIINTEEIDSASRIIANEFDEILKLED